MALAKFVARTEDRMWRCHRKSDLRHLRRHSFANIESQRLGQRQRRVTISAWGIAPGSRPKGYLKG